MKTVQNKVRLIDGEPRLCKRTFDPSNAEQPTTPWAPCTDAEQKAWEEKVEAERAANKKAQGGGE